jgi:hypothetical protein
MKAVTAVLQRKCACGKESKDGGSCAECIDKEKRPLQRFSAYSVATKEIAPRNAEFQFLEASAFEPFLSSVPVSSSGSVFRKLMIGGSNDPLEQEADRIADHVSATPPHSAVGGAPPRIQHSVGQVTEGADTAPASVDRALANPGRPLEPTLRQDMEQRFGYDFSRVQVHSGAEAEKSARDVSAYAYTVGHSVVFGAGRFAPDTHEGRRLIAHELTHVVQQAGRPLWSAGDDRRTEPHAGRLIVGVGNTGCERESDPVAGSAGAPVRPDSVPFNPSSSLPVGTLARQADTQAPTKEEQSADRRAMRLARSPAQAIMQWRGLPLNDQRLVLIRMTAMYGADFAAAFLPYARGEKKPNFSTSIETGTPAALVARGFRDAGIVGGVPTWVHPSGQEVNLVAKGRDREDCANLCSDTTGESECMACCDEKVNSDNPDCMSSCRTTCTLREQ